MKNLFLILSALFVMYGCSAENGIIEDPTNGEIPENPKEYIVSFGFTGEITDIEESPLSRAVSNDLYGIQVYSMPASETDTKGYKPYAYGLFESKTGMTIKLLEGYKYKFISTMVVDGSSKILSQDRGYSIPFYTEGFTPAENLFIYSSKMEFVVLSNGSAHLKKESATADVPNTDRYYGELSDYRPSEGGSVFINMNRVSFGFKVVEEGLTEGKLTISMKGGIDMNLHHPDSQVEDIFTFKNTDRHSNALAWTRDDYSETIPVSISWEKSDGAIVPLATQDITFKRNIKTTITVKVKDNSIDNGIDISNENTPMGDGDHIVIEGGDGSDTEVNPS